MALKARTKELLVFGSTELYLIVVILFFVVGHLGLGGSHSPPSQAYPPTGMDVPLMLTYLML
jgi:hypothetical protein